MELSPKRSVTALPSMRALPFSETSTHSVSGRALPCAGGWPCAAAAQAAIKAAKEQGGKVLYGGKVLKPFGSATFVLPTIIEIDNKKPIVQSETFAPVLYVMKYKRFEQAIKMHNDVPQGLSSAVYTDSVSEGEGFLSYLGSDCGIANINIGTSGAEIGGAFGGEKETGGGRESGSDSWKMYMRRQTNTINWGGEVHLAQGVEFKA